MSEPAVLPSPPAGAGVRTGSWFLNGDEAVAEGALAAGCRFFGGYPITPATEIAEVMARRLPGLGGVYIQMEDEIASLAAVLGASWGARKSMTATSGPGFSLMMENYGLGLMTETPCVIVDVMRAGPSTGLPTATSQGDVMQARWGTHGDVGVIALVPSSPQECFDLTVEAFNLSEEYRMPVVVLADEVIGHMRERVVIPPASEIRIVERRVPGAPPSPGFLPFEPGEDLVPPMACAGEGYRVHVTGLTHDERGYPVLDAPTQRRLVGRLLEKVRRNAPRILRCEEVSTEDAEVLVVAYGSVARSAREAVRVLRGKGVKAGLLRPITVWPFPTTRVRALARRVRAIVVPEVNFGQVAYEVDRCARGRARVSLMPLLGGSIHAPGEIADRVEEVLR
ncbi:MAG: 2-oxoacid:acceptor oxidoreductase subunit alpha [Planctomycetaceae bacterium]|nr:2-oxoacid:acceptor oxidoreductase subunit alpha [Planctomycetota bacterium]NUN51756.1 2-oxoacid:acceptor oxidoreductase subunit alpha [Planctomycetaceae bacterium]